MSRQPLANKVRNLTSGGTYICIV